MKVRYWFGNNYKMITKIYLDSIIKRLKYPDVLCTELKIDSTFHRQLYPVVFQVRRRFNCNYSANILLNNKNNTRCWKMHVKKSECNFLPLHDRLCPLFSALYPTQPTFSHLTIRFATIIFLLFKIFSLTKKKVWLCCSKIEIYWQGFK